MDDSYCQRSGRRRGRRFVAVPALCAWCGEPFLALVSNVRKGHGKYCSHYCATKAQRAAASD